MKAMTTAMEHHFDNHDYCNPSWCHFRDDSIRKSDNTVCGKLRNIHSNPANKIVYDEVKKFMIRSLHMTTYSC